MLLHWRPLPKLMNIGHNSQDSISLVPQAAPSLQLRRDGRGPETKLPNVMAHINDGLVETGTRGEILTTCVYLIIVRSFRVVGLL